MRDLRVSTRQPYALGAGAFGRDGQRGHSQRLLHIVPLDVVRAGRRQRGLPGVLRSSPDTAIADCLPFGIDLLAEAADLASGFVEWVSDLAAAMAKPMTDMVEALKRMTEVMDVDPWADKVMKSWEADALRLEIESLRTGSYHVWMTGEETVTEVREPCRAPEVDHDHRAIIYRPNGKVLYEGCANYNFTGFSYKSLGLGYFGDRTVIIGCCATVTDPWADHSERANKPPDVGVWGWKDEFYALVGPCHAGPQLWKIKLLRDGTILDAHCDTLEDLP